MFERFLACERGNYALITAITMVPLMAAVAGVVDFTGMRNDAAKLQNALDATALAVGTVYYSDMTGADLRQLGEKIFISNMMIPTSQELQVDDVDRVPGFDISADQEGEAHFISAASGVHHQGIVGALNWSVRRSSYVKVTPGQPACVLALDKSASKAVKIQGSTNVSMPGCVVASNSSAPDSVYRGGSARIEAACVLATGGAVGFDSGSDLDCGAPLQHQYPSFDPLESVMPPSYTACQTIHGGQTATLSPGTYCNKNWSGNITLDPGVYVLRDIDINLNGNGSLIGAGVTIFLMGNSQFTVNGNSVVKLSPPSSGEYAGITIFQARDNASSMIVNGTSGSDISGFIYAPDASITYTGNSGTSAGSECLRVVGNTVEMSGNSAIKSDCTAELGGRMAYAGRVVTLVK
jgi:hypothetical protein